MSSAEQMRAEFADFLSRVAERAVSVQDWNRFAVTHYSDDSTEAARRELVRTCIELSQCSTCVVPPGLEVVAQELRERLLDTP